MMGLGQRRGFADGGVPPGVLGANSSVPAQTEAQAKQYPTMAPPTAIAQPAFNPQPFASAIGAAPSLAALSGGPGSNGVIAAVNGQGVPSGSPSAPMSIPNKAFTPPVAPPPTAGSTSTTPNLPSSEYFGGLQLPPNMMAKIRSDGTTAKGHQIQGSTPLSDLSPDVQKQISDYYSANNLTFKRGGRTKGFAGGGGIPTSEAMDPWYTRAEERGAVHPEGLIASTGAGRTDVHNIQVPAGSYILPADVTSGIAEGNSLAGAAVMDRMMHSNPYGIQGGSRHGSGVGMPRAPKPFVNQSYENFLDATPRASGGSVNTAKTKRKPVDDFNPDAFKNLSVDDIANALPPYVISPRPATQPPASTETSSPGQNQVPWGGYAKGGSAEHKGELVPIVVAGGEMLYHPATIIKKFGSLKKGHAVLDALVKRVRADNVETLRKLPGPKS